MAEEFKCELSAEEKAHIDLTQQVAKERLEGYKKKYGKTYNNVLDESTLNEIQSLYTDAQRELIELEDEINLSRSYLQDTFQAEAKAMSTPFWTFTAKAKLQKSKNVCAATKKRTAAAQDFENLIVFRNYLQGRVAYFEQLLREQLGRVEPHFIPHNFKLESDDFNKIAHFRILPVFNKKINSYVQDKVILSYKRKLIEAAIDSRDSFRFTMLPLFIQNISYGSSERTNMLPLISDFYDSYHYGRAPQVLSISGIMLDTPETNASAVITMLYMDFFRLSHVSRIGVPLTLEIGDKLFTGAFVSLNINKTTQGVSDMLQVDFEFLVLEYFAYTQYNMLDIKNTHDVIW